MSEKYTEFHGVILRQESALIVTDEPCTEEELILQLLKNTGDYDIVDEADHTIVAVRTMTGQKKGG